MRHLIEAAGLALVIAGIAAMHVPSALIVAGLAIVAAVEVRA